MENALKYRGVYLFLKSVTNHDLAMTVSRKTSGTLLTVSSSQDSHSSFATKPTFLKGVVVPLDFAFPLVG